jgi:type 1 glutamine amidotransferase
MVATVAVASAEPKNVLVFSLTQGFRHKDAIEIGNPILKRLAEECGYTCTISEDLALLGPDQVKQWQLIIYNNCTSRLQFPEAEKREAFLRRIREDGAGFMGFHAATDCNYDWPEYGEMINGYFAGHPWNQVVQTRLEDPTHPLLAPFAGNSFEVRDEIYQFRNYKRSNTRVLMSIDNRSVDVYKGGREDRDYAICWIRPYGKGRVYYSAHGHYGQVFEQPSFQQHVKLAMQWGCGDLDVDTTPSPEIDRAALAAKALASLKAATTDAERLEALDVLSFCPAAEALPLVLDLLASSQEVASMAAGAALAICESSTTLEPTRKIEILRQALLSAKNKFVQKNIRTQLKKLGVTDLPVNAPPGFIGKWQVAGPVPDPKKELFDQAVGPESGVDLKAGFKVGDTSFAWKEAFANDDGIVDLNEALGRRDNVAGYMFAEVTLPAETDAELRLGSDDGFVLWLNGERLGGQNVSRGISPGSDVFKARLKAGPNHLLMKVLQGGGDWSGSLQLVGTDGKPLPAATGK